MQNVEIRKATVSDSKALQAVAKVTFLQTFGALNSDEDMAAYLDLRMSEEQLGRELRNPDSEFFLATVDEHVVGYLKLNAGQAQTESVGGNALEIERIYVLAQFQGKAVGQKLYEAALEIAHRRRVEYIWLGVWDQNPRAIRFYEKNGFVPFGKHVFKLGHDEQTDVMMKKALRAS